MQLYINTYQHKIMTPTTHMLPKDYTEQDKQEVIEANQHLFVWGGDKGHCPYARKFFDEEKKVIECNFDDPTFDVPTSAATSYLDAYLGLGPSGMYAIPLGMFGFSTYGYGNWSYADDGYTSNKLDKK